MNQPGKPARPRRPSTTSGKGAAVQSNPGVPAPQPGDVVGTYEVVERIGSGAMGRVYKVVDQRNGQPYAMKTLRGRYAFDADAVSRFFLEADATAKLRHPNVVAIVDFVDAPPFPPSFVMELLEGETLADRIERVGALPVARAVMIGRAVASAMAVAHAAAIVHRDLKPENVFLGTQESVESVKILDFGIAKLLDASLERKHETAIGRQIGTPGYMAPEQVMGTAVDHRADIYALGIVLFEALTARLPHEGRSAGEILVAIAKKDAPPPSMMRAPGLDPIPAWLDAAVLACLRKQPHERPQSMHDVEVSLGSR